MGNTIWAIGRNYTDHAKEMSAAIPKEPLVFMKSFGCLNQSNKIEIPEFTSNLHFELEVAVQLGNNLAPAQIALALDLTARDQQTIAKQSGLPWTLAKSFKNACPISPWIPFENQAWFDKIEFKLHTNKSLQQTGLTSKMIFSLDKIINHLKEFFPVQSGDIILTGTPSGVGPLNSGDQLEATLNQQLHWQVSVY